MPDELIGPKDVAALLGVPTSWVYSRFEAKELPGFRCGKYVRFRPSEIDAWLEAQRAGPGPTAAKLRAVR